MLYAPELMAPAWAAALALGIIIACTLLAVLSHVYDDNIGQRTAMAIVCLAAFTRLSMALDAGSVPAEEAALHTGVALYALATAAKILRRWLRAGRPSHPIRRSTDFGPFDATASAANSTMPMGAEALQPEHTATDRRPRRVA